VLGEDLVDDEFKNFVIDSLLRKLRGSHGDAFWDAAPKMISTIYAGTPEGSPARKLMADIFAYGVDGHQMAKLIPQLPQAFHFDLMISFATGRKAKPFPEVRLRRCDYHQH
jgi:hypothetical protein